MAAITHLGLTATPGKARSFSAKTDIVAGPFLSEAGFHYTPGSEAGESYTPGSEAGESYAPGSEAGVAYTAGSGAGAAYTAGSEASEWSI